MTNWRSLSPISAAVVSLPLLAGIGVASHAISSPQNKAEEQRRVDKDALDALDKMGASLRSRTALSLNANIVKEDVLGSGQKLQYEGTLDIRARRPDRFRIISDSDTQKRQIYYDGKTVTIFSPRQKLYASFAAPPTIGETLRMARDRFNLEIPIAELFTWGNDQSQIARLTSGFFVRTEHIGSQACNHFAFRQKNVDWQIWIAADEMTLPCKLVITRTDDPSRPQYTASFHWSSPANMAESDFTFKPPGDARKIEIVALDQKSVASDQKSGGHP